MWSEPTAHFDDKKLIRIYFSALNVKEQAQLIPFNIVFPNYPQPLFEYASYTTSVGRYLTNGIKIGLKYETTICQVLSIHFFNRAKNDDESINAIKCSLTAMFLRISKSLKNLTITGTIDNKMMFEYLYRNTTITMLGFNNFNSNAIEILVKAFCKNTTLTSLDLFYNVFNSEGWESNNWSSLQER